MMSREEKLNILKEKSEQKEQKNIINLNLKFLKIKYIYLIPIFAETFIIQILPILTNYKTSSPLGKTRTSVYNILEARLL